MATELLPVVDLRTLSQSDLDALATVSSHALAPGSCPDPDSLPPLKIDRAVFNESAGSRKQTFSRLRLGAAASSPTARHTSSSSAPRSSVLRDPNSGLIAYHLRRLFVPNDPSLPPPEEFETLALTEPSPPPDPDRETTNSKGISVDLVRLARTVDPYDAELRRRTAGMASETELMGFISSLAGKWATQRRRRKFVDASFFGDHLPRGWKLLLGLKRKDHMTWVHCFSYVSPKGSQFATCKEVSAYLMSLLGYPEANTVTTQYNSTGKPDLCGDDDRDDVIGFQHQTGSSVDNPNVFFNYSGHLKDKNERNIDTVNAFECQKSNLTFQDQDCYSQHNLSSHEMTAKRRRTGKFGEPVVGKDGKFECPVCRKTFAEESRYFGHFGAHARYDGINPGTFLDKITSGKVDSNSLAEISFSFKELTEPNNKASPGAAGYQHLSGPNEHGSNSSKVKELFSANHLDGSTRPNETWLRHEEISPFAYSPSAFNVAVPQVTSNCNGQPDCSRIGSEVIVHNDQAGSHHVFRPNTFGIANRYKDQIADYGMASKHDVVNNTVKARDVNCNPCLGTSSFPFTSANNETSTALNKDSHSTFTAKCFNGSISNNGGSSSNSGSGGKANFLANKNNTMAYQSNMGMRPVSPVETEARCVASRSFNLESSGKGCASNTKQQKQMDNAKSSASNDVFGFEAYNNFGGASHERGFAQFSSSFTQLRPNVSSRCSLPESNMPKASNLTKGSDVTSMNRMLVNRSDVNCTRDSFVNRHISNNESNVSMHDTRRKSNDKMQNCNDNAPSCIPPATAISTSQNVNGRASTLANYGSMSSMVHSVGDAAMSSRSQDQCDLQLGFGVQKQQIFSGYEELRSNSSGSPQLDMPRNNSLSTGSSQFRSMDRPNSFPAGSSQFGSLARPNFVPTSFQFGIMARPDSFSPAESSHFVSIARPNPVPHAKSTQFENIVRPNGLSPPDSSQFGSMPRPNCVPPPANVQFGSMVGHNSVLHAKSSQFGSIGRPNSVPPASSSQFGSTAGSNSLPPAEASQFGGMPRQNFESRTEPTLVLGYAPQMGNGPPVPVQVEWDLSSPKVTGGMMTCVCIWCNSQFHHFGPPDGQQTGSFGFICPACKEKISGHPTVRSNGSWQP